MPRGELTRGSVLQAVAEFDDVGRSAFLQRYGFNGARDYFLLLDGKRYDSKAIVAVANKWAPGGGGQPLTALELSGGRSDAAKRLLQLGFDVTERQLEADLRNGQAVPNFDAAYARFQRNIAAFQKDVPFSGFHEGVAAAWEGYKPRLRQRALQILTPEGWTEAAIGSGEILRRTIDAIEIHDDRLNLINNLVFWQNRYGHANRDHRGLLEAVDQPTLGRELEGALFDLFHGDNEPAVFERLTRLAGARYPLLAYLFFLKDIDRFLPIQPTGFDQAFHELGITLRTLRHCEWENYCQFNAVIDDVRTLLVARAGITPVRLIDAHSFCWLLVKVPEAGQWGARGQDPGRVLGARAKAVVNMRLSIEHTVRQSNGQQVLRTVKNKELHLDRRALDQLLERQLDIQGNRCALTGIPFLFDGSDANRLPSPDRIDSEGHYAAGNMQIVCQFVNFWKCNMPDEEFRRLLALVRAVDT